MHYFTPGNFIFLDTCRHLAFIIASVKAIIERIDFTGCITRYVAGPPWSQTISVRTGGGDNCGGRGCKSSLFDGEGLAGILSHFESKILYQNVQAKFFEKQSYILSSHK